MAKRGKYLVANCHPFDGVSVYFDAKRKVVTIECAACRAFVVELNVKGVLRVRREG